MIKFNDLKIAFSSYEEELKHIASEVIASGWFISGPRLKECEARFSNYLGAKHCVGVGNGTDALEIALRAVGVGKDDEVLNVANAGGYTTSACLSIGAVPVYYDIDENLLGDPNSMASAITSKTKAIVVTHLYGQAADVEAFRKLAGDIPIVEDCAEAHGAKINGKFVGSIGDIAAFSFYPTKNLGALGYGGAIVTNSDETYAQIKLLHQYGWESKYRSSIPYGRNSRLDEIQAAFLSFLLTKLPEMNEKRVAIAEKYKEAAPSLFTHLKSGENYVGHLAIAKTNNREKFRVFFDEKEIATDIHFPVLDCDQKSVKSVEHRSLDLKISRDSVEKIVSLPCYPNMRDVEKVCDALREWESDHEGKI